MVRYTKEAGMPLIVAKSNAERFISVSLTGAWYRYKNRLGADSVILALSIWCLLNLIAEAHWTWAIGKLDPTWLFWLPFVLLGLTLL